MKKQIIITLFAAATLLASCKGDQGAIGPAGSNGAAGATGPAGTNGTNGIDGAAGVNGMNGATGAIGATGTANVIYSDWKTGVAFTLQSGSYVGTITAPMLTADNLDKADIKVYMKIGGDVIPLPISTTVSGATVSVYPKFSLGTITLVSTNQIPASPAFRYVIIPGGVLTTRKAAVDLNNYEEVKRMFNLPQ